MKKLNGDGEENDDVQLYFTLHLFRHRLIEVRAQDFVAAAIVTPGGTFCLYFQMHLFTHWFMYLYIDCIYSHIDLSIYTSID